MARQLLQRGTGLDGEPELGQLPGRELEAVAAALADRGEDLRDPFDRPCVQGRVPAVELRVPGGEEALSA